MTGKHTAERLMQVVRVLEELRRPKRFDLGTWGECSTTACAIGWAGLDPWFRRRGFRTEKYYDGTMYPMTKRTCSPFDAVSQFFEIRLNEVGFLFTRSPGYHTKRDVIRRIRKFVREECG